MVPKRAHPVVPGAVGLRRRLGKRIRELRHDRGISQSEVGGAHYDRKYVSAVELGRITPSLPALLQFSRALGVSISKLVNGIEPPTSKRS